MQKITGADAALAAVLDVPMLPRTATDDEVLTQVASWEAVGRAVDARRVRAAAEVEWRSRPQLGASGLAERHGAKGGADLVADTARIGTREAKRRIGIGTALLPRVGLAGDELPSRLPWISAAVAAGEVGLEAARPVVEVLHASRRVASIENLDAAEQLLTGHAAEVPLDVLHIHAALWAARLDPDRAQPQDEVQRKNRMFRLGYTGTDGLTPFSGRATPELAVQLKEALHAPAGRAADLPAARPRGCRGPRRAVGRGRRRSAHRRAGEPRHPRRSRQRGVHAEHEGWVATKTAHEVIVHVTADELERRAGGAWSSAILTRLPIPTVERIACDGSTRLIVTGTCTRSASTGDRPTSSPRGGADHRSHGTACSSTPSQYCSRDRSEGNGRVLCHNDSW